MENNEELKCGTPDGTQEDTLQEIENPQGTPNAQPEPTVNAPSDYGQPSLEELRAQQQPNPVQQPNPYQGSPYQAQQPFQAQQPQQPYQPQPWVYRSGDGTPPRSAQPRRRTIWPAVLVTALCCLLIGGLLGGIFLPGLMNKNSETETQQSEVTQVTPQLPDAPQGEAKTGPVTTNTTPEQSTAGQDPNFTFGGEEGLTYVASGSLADMAEEVTPSIVGILNLQKVSANNGYYGYYGYYGYGRQQNQQPSEPTLQEVGSGSGVIISADGYIVTNAHVVEDADALKVLIDGEEVDAILVGSDPVTDLAVVKIDRTGLPAATLGDSDKVRVGELAVAIGNPLGNDLAGTVTMGIISATNRTIEVDGQYIDVLQTDAAINPGNSGGALVDQNGNVIGITSAKTVVAGYDSTGNAISAEGIGYAIPINNAKPIIEQLIRTGSVPRPALGVTVNFVTNRLDNTQTGILIASVTSGSCADKAGLKVNDVIRKLDGEGFESLSDFKKLLMAHSVGDTITLTVERDDQTLEIQVTLMDSKELSTETEEEGKESQWSIPGYGGYTPFG